MGFTFVGIPTHPDKNNTSMIDSFLISASILKAQRYGSAGAGFIGDPLEPLMYARHGRELMG